MKLADTKLFRKVARAVLKQHGYQIKRGYTDTHSDPNKRYCSYWFSGLLFGNDPMAPPLLRSNELDAKIVEQIEFILWSQGVTAQTRMFDYSLRGTCVIK